MDGHPENAGFGLLAEVQGEDRNVGMGSTIRIQNAPETGLECGDEQTFSLECRQSGHEWT